MEEMEVPLAVRSYYCFCFAQQDEGYFTPSRVIGVPLGCKPNSCGDERICGNDWCCSLRLPEPDKTISLRVGNSLLLL